LIMLCGTVYIVKAVLHEALPNCARLTTTFPSRYNSNTRGRW
jgi:hypothetical protein